MGNSKLIIIAIGAIIAIGVAFAAVYNFQDQESTKSDMADITPDEAKQIAEKAFIYAYPMLENYHTMYNSAVDKSSSLYVAPFNVIHNNKALATPADKWVVTPNSDTIYSRFWTDLRAEPVILTIPPIEKDRYYSFQLVDFYTNNFKYIGARTEGNNGGTYLIAGPNWDGKTPAGIDGTVQSLTDFIYVLGRTEVLSNNDVKNTLAIMDKYKLQTQSEFLGKPAPSAAPSIDFIPWDKDKGYGSDFVNYFNLMLTWSKVPASEKQLYDDFAKIGIKEGATVDWSTVDPAIKSAIGQGAKSGFDKIKGNLANLGTFDNGWLLEDAFGDANWRAKNYLLQATGDMIGLYGNTKIEAFYPVAFTDADKKPLDASKNTYVIKFSSEPPVDAFWSLSMYDAKSKLFVENSINRYLVNSLIDLKKNSDGSFEIYIQPDSPGKDKESNWLPAPDGGFYMVMRTYLPGKALLDNTWKVPEIVVTPKS